MDTIHNWDAWIGTDEAGKGDYFGPLVVAAVYVDAPCRETLSTLGIIDGKKLSNRRIQHLAELMHNDYARHIVVVENMPIDYNILYNDLRRRGRNLNHLLASLHGEAIRTLATRVGVKHVLVDQFSKNDLITQQLKEKIETIQVPKAERDIAVAAASIIARDTFLKRMEALSEKYEMRLPRGSYQVVDAGRAFIRLHGSDVLGEVAKLHFSLTEAVLRT
ncbi:MAG: ribonuclease HIII [Candidatus Poribacteria bacterium]|nr:ribonuclease HIII [Candidatus Poribacteria bacterium]